VRDLSPVRAPELNLGGGTLSSVSRTTPTGGIITGDAYVFRPRQFHLMALLGST
jgi:hypothetical protein